MTGFYSQWQGISPYKGSTRFGTSLSEIEAQPASETCFYKSLDDGQSPKKGYCVVSHASASRLCSVELHGI